MNLKNLWTRFIHILFGIVKSLCWFLIKFYQVALSPHMGGVCRFYPTCSCYAEECFKNHDLTTAFRLTAKRLLKCHPGGPKGFDPVPMPRSLR